MEAGESFWDKNACRYDRFMRRDAAAYAQMNEWMEPVVRHKTVLETAAGTGRIAKALANAASFIEVTDASAEMIARARAENASVKLHFSVQDIFALPYADASFDVVIAANVLHVIPRPERALAELRRVLKDGGVLIAPTFTHAGSTLRGRCRAGLMRMAGFPLHSRWRAEEYLDFLRENGWQVERSATLHASFPLTYAECTKAEASGGAVPG